jgi:hypothetical protein
MPVSVPNVIGLDRTTAEAKLDAALLRHIAKFPFSASGDGSAATQDPAAGTMVPPYTVVTVSYPSLMGPLEDTPVLGPTLPAGTYDGKVTAVMAGNPWGSGQGAWIDFVTELSGSPVTFTGTLYFDHAVNPGAPPDRTEWARRGAMLGIAERAFTNSHQVRLVTAQDLFIQSIEIRKA